jgi:YggT family protein
MDLVISGLAQVLDTVLFIYMWIVIISALLSWVNPDPYNPIVQFLRRATEPAFYFVRRHVPFAMIGGFDLSPLFIILGIQFLKVALVGNMYRLAAGLS